MYEALQAHGVQHGRVTHVTGGGHTDAAGKVHERLAARHGFRYRPRAGGEFNDRGPYKYAVKSVVEQFDLVKMALQPRIAGRRQTGENEWDYSHLLPAHHRNQFRLIVRDRLPEEDDSETPPRSMAHLVVRPGSEVARILAGDRLFPHTDEYSVGHVGGVHIGKQGLSVAREASTAAHLHPMLRNNGLGKALYSALYTHALALGRPHVAGSGHSEEAGRVHESLAREHGFEYDAERGDDGRGSYGYTLKSEDTGPMRLTKAFSGLPLPRLNRRVNLRLPVGTWDATSGRIKIRKPDGSEVWHQAKVGLIASSSPATAGADFGNPTSARNPSG
jgi:GNAT superfamily N-acetyltransferase